MPTRLPLLLAVLATAACTAAPAPESAAPSPVPSTTGGAFIVQLGVDTIAVEQYTRTGNVIEGQLIQRAPATIVQHYTLTLNPDGTPASIVARPRRADGTPVPNRPTELRVTFTGDSASLAAVMADSTINRRFAAARAFPLLGNSFALYEVPLGWMRRTGADSLDVQFVGVGTTRTTAYPARLVGPDSARVYYFGDPQRIHLDASGRVLAIDGTGTTNKIRVTRVDRVDIPALAAAFAARDAAGGAIGTSSPRDTVRSTIGGAEIMVDYGRPSRRGRDLWARGVLGDTLWRTGANAATQIRFARDVELGGHFVPAGLYTLYTLASGGRYTLIVNRQTGQWGTEYNPAQDVVRVPLTIGTTAETERFTIAVVPEGSGGRLALRWGTRELWAPIAAR